MSLQHILLGMLREPASGYALRQEFEAGAQHFWSAHLGQIYPALQSMEQRRWLRSKQQPSAQGPPQRVYRRTSAGTRELFSWLKAEPVVGKERFAYIGQLIFMGELDDPQRTREFIRQLRQRLAGTLHFLQQATEPLDQQFAQHPGSLSPVEFHELLAVRMGTRSLTAKVNWCDESLEMIETWSRRHKNVRNAT